MSEHSTRATPQSEASGPPGPSSQKFRVTRRGRRLRRLVTGLALIMVVVTVSGAAFLLYANHKIDSKGFACAACVAVAQPGSGAPATPFNVLVLGSDTRAVLNGKDQALLDPTGVDRNGGQRADTIAVVHVSPATGKAILVNVPRDLRVPTPDGRGYEKINAYYNNGPSSMVAAVERLTGLGINHYIEVNFNSFRTITDALGGVNIRFDRRIVDPNSGLNQPAGCNLLTGDQALAFVRDRDTDSDFGRIARQQLFVKQMIAKVLTPGTLLNPVKVASLVNLGLGTVKHDSGLNLHAMTSLALKFHSFSAKNIDFRVLPSAADPTPIAGQLYVLENVPEANALFAAIKNGTPLPAYGKQASAQTAPSISPDAVPVTVLNGTTIPGLAYKVAGQLAAKGYPVRATHNADNQNYRQTVLYYTPGHQAAAQFLGQTQFPGAQVMAIPAQLQALIGTLGVSNSSAVVVLGPQAAGSPGSAGASAAPSPSPPANEPAGPPIPVASQSFASAC